MKMNEREKSVRRYAVWSGDSERHYLVSCLFDSHEEAEGFVDAMPSFYRERKEEALAVDWENEKHVIVSVDIENPFERGEAE